MALFQRIRTPVAQIAPEGEAPIRAGWRSAGDVLRQQREALGLELGEVAAALCIKPGYLAALEEGRPDRLPGLAYAVGFMRAYADHLGLDAGEILRRFRREAAGLDTKPDLSFPIPLDERGVPGGRTLLLALILAICGYATWYYLSTDERSRPERVTEVPADLLAPTPAPPAAVAMRVPAATAKPRLSTAGTGAEPTPDPASRSRFVSDNRQPTGAVAPGGAPLAAAATAAFAPPSPPPATASPPAGPQSPPRAAPSSALTGSTEPTPAHDAAGAPSRIVLQATADSWIEVRDANRTVLFTGVLKPGETYRVPDRPGLSLRAGNAGGLSVLVDGKPAPALGPPGAVRRNIALDPQSLTAAGTVR